MNQLKSTIILTSLSALLVWLGYLIGDRTGALCALGLAAACNGWCYWFGAEMAVRATGARLADPAWPPDKKIIDIVRDLAGRAQIPVPYIGIMEAEQANAFAAGRDPQHAVLVVSTGLLHHLTPQECAGVLAHELAHIKARDTLTTTISATVAGTVAGLAAILALIGLVQKKHGGWFLIVFGFLAAAAALILEMMLSRTREYEADREGARICGDPKALASALRKLSEADQTPIAAIASQPHLAPAFFVNPLGGEWLAALFDTHPPIEKRIARLEAM